jgi:sugar-specific transcriptional regulator TrmB
MESTTKNALLAIGLTVKESSLYLTLLKNGKMSVSQMSAHTGLKRTTLYSYLETLMSYDLLKKVVIGKRIGYSVKHPRALLEYLRNERAQLEIKFEKIQSVLPLLTKEYNQSKNANPSHVVVQQGVTGILRSYTDFLDTWQNVYAIFTPSCFFEIFSFEQNHNLLMRLQERSLKVYQLVERSEITEKRLLKKTYDSFVKSKLLPENLRFETDILVSGNRLLLISFKTLTAITIEDSALAKTQKEFIKSIWDDSLKTSAA